MALSTETNKKSFVAISGQTKFDFNIPYFETSDISVVRVDTDGTTTTLSYNASPSTATQFSVTATNSNTANGATITLGGTATTNSTYTVTRTVNLKQQYDLQEGSTIDPTALNKALDRVVAQNQQQENTISTNTTNITTNTASIATNASNITSNDTDIATNASNIATNTSNISTNTANISTNTSNISTNTSNISTNTGNISTNTGNISTNTSNISTNTSNIATNTSNIATNTSNISTNTSNISTNTSNISTNTSNIASNTTKINTLEETVLTSDKTVNIAAGSSASTIQGLINDQPKNLNGYNLTFTFAGSRSNPQTYDLGTTQLNFDGFHGGDILVQGNPAETPTNRTSQEIADGKPALGVKIQTQNVNAGGAMFFEKCTMVFVEHLEFEHNGTGTTSDILRFYYHTFGVVQYCIITNTNTKGNDGVFYQDSHGHFREVRVSNLDTVLKANSGSMVAMVDCDLYPDASPLVAPNHKLQSQGGSIVTQGGSRNFDATVSQVYINTGGVVTPREGFIFDENILSAGTTLTITQSGGESTTQCVVSGHTSATFNASDYSNNASSTINAAIESLPKNMGGHNIDIIVGTTGGQEITVSNQINIHNFDGGVVTVKSAKTADNSDDGSTKANKIVSAGTTIDRIFSINKCSECNVQGLELKENTGTQSSSYVVVVSTSWSDINHCKLTGGGVIDNQRALLSQRGANVWLRDSWVDNVATGILINNSAIASQSNCSWTGTQPITGMYATKGIGITSSGTTIQGSTNEYIAANGGLITNEQGIILEETILQASKTVNFDNSMSVSDMQALINVQPKNLNGKDITFQFADGTYDFQTSNLVFQNFEGGTINIYGNTGNTDIEALAVKLQSENTGGNGAFLIEECSRVSVKNIAFEQNGSNTDTNLLNSRYASNIIIEGCSFNSLNGTTTNDAIAIVQSWAYISNCYFKNLEVNVLATQSSKVHVEFTSDFSSGNSSEKHIRAQSGTIVTQTATQASGTQTKETGTGAVIFSSSGTLV